MIAPGTYVDQRGMTCIIESIGIDGRLYGYIPGVFTYTWWRTDGRHNLYRDHDLRFSSSTA